MNVSATNHATIDAIVGAFAAALGVGFVGGGIAIGIALAHNTIGWKATSLNPTTTYNSDQTGATLTPNVTTVKIANGPGKGDVFQYIGTQTLTGVDLRQGDYRNPTLWKQINLSDAAAPVEAYIKRSSVSATSGDITLTAHSMASIHALTIAAAAAISGGVVGIGLSGAGAASENRINMKVQAYIDGDGATGISAQDVSLDANDSSTIDALTGSAALALSVGVISVSVAIGVGIAKNEIASQTLAYIANADGSTSDTTDYGVDASGDITIGATNGATITSTAFAAAAAAGVGLGSFAIAGAGVNALNVILGKTKAYVDQSDVSATGDVSITADDEATIEAHVLAFAAAVTIGGVAGAVSIGVAIANNYIGFTSSGSAQAAEVQAYVTNSSLNAGGSLEIGATEHATITADIATTSVSVSVGAIAVGGSGAGVTIENKVNVLAKAYIDTTRNGGIDAFDVTITAQDTSTITATARAVSFSVSVGVVSGSVAISISLAQNTIQSDVEAYATSASIATTSGDLTITATEAASITSDSTASAVAVGVTFSVAGGGATSNATITTVTKAYADPVELDVAGDVTIDAIATTTATTTSTGHATSASFIGLSGAETRATSTIHPKVESSLGGYTTGNRTASADGNIWVASTLAASATATAEGGSFGTTVSAGGATAIATISPVNSTTPMVKSGITAGTVHAGGALDTHAVYNADVNNKVSHNGTGATASATASSGSILISTSGASATATDTPYVDTYVGSGASLSAGGEIKVTGSAISKATANGFGDSGGIVGIGRTTTSATASGHVTTRMDGDITGGTNVDVKAITSDKATATSRAASGGLYAQTKNDAAATSSGNVDAHVGADSSAHSIFHVTGNIEISAEANPEADADTRGVAVGGISVGGSESTLTVSPTVIAYIGAGSQIQAGSLSLRATAQPTGSAPTFVITGASNANDTVTVAKHGLETGDAVEYERNGNTAVVDYNSGPTAERVFKEDGSFVDINVNRQFNVIAVGTDTIAFGNTLDDATVDSTFDTITFAQPHNFVSGDKVRFIGTGTNLTNNGTYYVLVIDERTIKLTATQDMALHPENYRNSFTAGNVSGNVITFTGSNTFVNGQAVTYYAPSRRHDLPQHAGGHVRLARRRDRDRVQQLAGLRQHLLRLPGRRLQRSHPRPPGGRAGAARPPDERPDRLHGERRRRQVARADRRAHAGRDLRGDQDRRLRDPAQALEVVQRQRDADQERERRPDRPQLRQLGERRLHQRRDDHALGRLLRQLHDRQREPQRNDADAFDVDAAPAGDVGDRLVHVHARGEHQRRQPRHDRPLERKLDGRRLRDGAGHHRHRRERGHLHADGCHGNGPPDRAADVPDRIHGLRQRDREAAGRQHRGRRAEPHRAHAREVGEHQHRRRPDPLDERSDRPRLRRSPHGPRRRAADHDRRHVGQLHDPEHQRRTRSR